MELLRKFTVLMLQEILFVNSAISIDVFMFCKNPEQIKVQTISSLHILVFAQDHFFGEDPGMKKIVGYCFAATAYWLARFRELYKL